MATITGDNSNNVLSGTSGPDSIVANGGNDTIVGSRRSDKIEGGDGTDTVDYSSLGSRVTLKARGEIEKPGAAGTDQIDSIERIIAAAGQRNLIDGRTPGGGPSSFLIDLSTNSLAVSGIPGLGTTQFEVFNFVDVTGTINNDNISGNSDNNLFGGSNGNDTWNGRGGTDTVDYSQLGQAITLGRAGTINKGSAGTDTIAEIETIVGAKNQRNKIDGGTGTSGTTSFDLDLGSERLTVNGIPGLGSSTFTLKNFLDVTGTSNSDTLVGNSQINRFTGSKGDDAIDGGGGKDVVDYTGLGQAVTLEAAGAIDKGSAGRDQIASIETIIGDAGFDNAIDGTVAGGNGEVSFAADLNARRVTVRGIPGIGRQNFQIQNFVDITGTSNNDLLTGDGADNKLVGLGGDDRIEGRDGNDEMSGGDGNDRMFGHNGNDTLLGGTGNDLLIGNGGDDRLNGVDSSQSNPGADKRDRLIGGPGSDLFILGEAGKVFYSAAGDSDYAEIADFISGTDKIQLTGSIGNYSLDSSGRKIFSTEGGGNELIAKLNGPFVDSDFVFA